MRIKQLLRQPEFQVFLFSLLFILLNWPFLAIPGSKNLISMFDYIYLLWGFFVLLLFVLHRSLINKDRDGTGNNERDS